MNLEEVRKHMAMRDRWLLLTEGQQAAVNMELADDVPDLVAEVEKLRKILEAVKLSRSCSGFDWTELDDKIKDALIF